ncbi:MAG: carbohydrate kinase [Kiritimatiellae bacterium]|nr:carbohydrate kinase [Kiritimatiellia bacterium]
MNRIAKESDHPVAEGKRFVVAGVGEALWDILPAGSRVGGAPANFAYHAAILGAESHVVSAVGDDALGCELRNFLEAQGLYTRTLSVIPSAPTGTVSVSLAQDGKPRYHVADDSAWDKITFGEQEESLAGRLDAVCFGTLAQRSKTSRAAIRRFLTLTRPGCLRILDVNLRGEYFDGDLIGASIKLANILKLNDEELPVMCRLLGVPGDENAALPFLLKNFNLRLVALTKGAEGCRVVTRNEDVHAAGAPIGRIADTVGAGDSFAAMLAMGLLEQWPPALIAARSNRLAAFVCSMPGGMPVIPANVLGAIIGAGQAIETDR